MARRHGRRIITLSPGLDQAAPAASFTSGPTPSYLRKHYWWAYVHPRAVRFFERQWLVNLILWGNYHRLRDAALDELGTSLPGRSLQIACVYGDMTRRICDRLPSDGQLDVVDVLPVQLENLRRKIGQPTGLTLRQANAADLDMPDGSYDRALLFFLMHEQPADIRQQTLEQAWRVVRPGGDIVIVDYARPAWWNPLRWLWLPVLTVLEPFAPDLWTKGMDRLLPEKMAALPRSSRRFFGGLYQMMTLRR